MESEIYSRNTDESKIDCRISYIFCFILSFLYVGSIYVWKQSTKVLSNHDSVIKKRMISVSVATILCTVCVSLKYFLYPSVLNEYSLLELLGFRWSGFINAIILPLILTIVLFLGPLIIEFFTYETTDSISINSMKENMMTFVWFRNYVFAPVTEEFVFRACMLLLLIDCTEPIKSIFICPLFFGAAHLHHMMEKVRFGMHWKEAFLISCFQFTYTTIFGAYSAYLFLRTGHIIAPILVHSFCNGMGFPNFSIISHLKPLQQYISIGSIFLGVILWIFSLKYLTQPSLYNNNLPWNLNI